MLLIFLLSSSLFAKTIPEKFTPKEKLHSVVVLIYGSPACGHCQRFSSNMQKQGIPFVFYDVTRNEKYNEEMWQKIWMVKPGLTSVSFPVLDIKGRVLVSPKYEKFVKVLQKMEKRNQ